MTQWPEIAPTWMAKPPSVYDVVTGFFPETNPKDSWLDNPRPLLVVGGPYHDGEGHFALRIAYGTGEKVLGGGFEGLRIANLTILDALRLKKPTKFVISSGEHMAILPWHPRIFRPWRGNKSPYLSRLPEEMQRHVGHVLGKLDNLPQP